MSDIEKKVEQLNQLHKEIADYKKERPAERVWASLSPGSILNAYREGDLAFHEALESLEARENKAVARKVVAGIVNECRSFLDQARASCTKEGEIFGDVPERKDFNYVWHAVLYLSRAVEILSKHLEK
jgi:hypothetical protein